MIEISKVEFQKYLEQYVDGKINSMTELIGILKTDYRTLNRRIIEEVSIDNPDLYYKVVMTHPYKQRSRTDIDFEALMIYVVKYGITSLEASDMFNIPIRTLRRNAEKVKITNPDLYELYKLSIGKNKKLLNNPEIQQKINDLTERNVVIGEINDEREEYLLDMEKKFNDLLASGMTKEQAASRLGHSSSYMNKALNELYRLKIEKNIKKISTRNKDSFKNALSDMSNYSTSTVENSNTNGVVANQTISSNKNNNEAR